MAFKMSCQPPQLLLLSDRASLLGPVDGFLHVSFNMIQVWGNEKEIYPKLAQDCQLPPSSRPALARVRTRMDRSIRPNRLNALKIRKQAYWSYRGHVDRSADWDSHGRRAVPHPWKEFLLVAEGLARRVLARRGERRIRPHGVRQPMMS